MGWNDLRNSTSASDRINQQREWAERRQEHIDEASRGESPGIFESATRKLGNLVSNYQLDQAEKRDLDWRHWSTDQKGIIDSPVDTARFSVYEKMMDDPTNPANKKAWAEIMAGSIPAREIK